MLLSSIFPRLISASPLQSSHCTALNNSAERQYCASDAEIRWRSVGNVAHPIVLGGERNNRSEQIDINAETNAAVGNRSALKSICWHVRRLKSLMGSTATVL